MSSCEDRSHIRFDQCLCLASGSAKILHKPGLFTEIGEIGCVRLKSL
jgi:hypothetical protein